MTWVDDPEGEDADDAPIDVLEADDLRCAVYEAMSAAGMLFTTDEVVLVATRLWRRGYVSLDRDGEPMWRAMEQQDGDL